MIRPFNEFIPVTLLGLVMLRALITRDVTRYWKSVVLAMVVTYGLTLGYIQLNARINGVSDLSWVTNVNLFGKVLEYHMQGDPVPPQYHQIQAATIAYAATGQTDPFAMVMSYHLTTEDIEGEAGTTYAAFGDYARYIITHNLGEYLFRSIPDLYQVWLTYPNDLYPVYGYNGHNALPQSAYNWALQGVTAYPTRQGLIPLDANPPWTDGWLILSWAEELSFGLLPVSLLGVLIWLWLDRKSTEAFLLLALGAIGLVTIGLTALAASQEFQRLRSPAEWAVYTVNMTVALVAIQAVRRAHTLLRPSAPRGSTLGATSVLSGNASPALCKNGTRDTAVAAADSVGPDHSTVISSSSLPDGHIQHDGEPQVVIMGGGPAGLSAAYELTRHRVPAIVLEQDERYVGGISRTVTYRGNRFDIGGHRFFSKSQEVEDLWTEVLGAELLVRPRLSRIVYQGKFFDYPLKAGNALWGLGLLESVRCLSSYAWARIHPVRNPQNVEDWVSNQFGHRLFSIFFRTYTEKVWGISTKELSADWAAQRIRGLSLGTAIAHALLPQKKKATGQRVVTTLIDQFRYPRLGPGQMWERMTERLRASGQGVYLGNEVVSIRHDDLRVTSVLVRNAQGAVYEVRGAHFISTLPMRSLVWRCDPPLPPPIQEAAERLKYRDFLTVAVIVNKEKMFPDNWIYLHDPNIIAGRIQNFKNWSPEMVSDARTTCLGLEYFCFEGDGLWASSDSQLIALAGRELVQLNMCRQEDILDGIVVRQQKAYPIYDDNYKQHLAVIRGYLDEHLQNLQLVGRNGMHHYNNQDHSIMTALLAARNIALGTSYDPWKVNTDAEYHEEARPEDEDRSGRQVPTRVARPQPTSGRVQP